MRRLCCVRKHTNKGSRTKQEDHELMNYTKIHGSGCWSTLSEAAGLQQCGKSCRQRWMNYLRRDIKRGKFGHDEEDLIVKLHALLGNRWSLIAGRLPGRTDEEVKNYWNSHLKRKLISMGVDPNNHRVNQTLIPSSRSTSKKHKPHISKESKFPVTDSTSSLEDEESVNSRDLNLDLTIALPSSSPPLLTDMEKKQDFISELNVVLEDPNVGLEDRNQKNSALTLFR